MRIIHPGYQNQAYVHEGRCANCGTTMWVDEADFILAERHVSPIVTHGIAIGSCSFIAPVFLCVACHETNCIEWLPRIVKERIHERCRREGSVKP
jgi:hypothetical protein